MKNMNLGLRHQLASNRPTQFITRILFLFASFAVLCALQGCATKTYGRQGSLTNYERDSMNCREIDLDLAKTRGFIDHVNEESKFSGKDVLAILGDFGIGNNMEKSAAIESANARIVGLNELKRTKQCPSISAQ